MKAITVRQPWASLIAAGAKTVETRSWSTRHRGRIAIHAGKRVPVPWVGPIFVGDFHVAQGGTWLHGPGYDAPMAFGAITTTAELVDVVPILEGTDRLAAEEPRPCVVVVGETLTLYHPSNVGGLAAGVNIDDQLPLGDFTPGRYAWLHDDIKPTTERCPACWGKSHELTTSSHSCLYPGCTDIYNIDGTHDGPRCPVCDGAGRCDPIPAKGHQRLWNWDPAPDA